MKKKILFIASLNSIHSLKWIDFFLNSKYEVTVISTTPKLESFKFSNKVKLFIFNKFKNKIFNTIYCILMVFLKKNFFLNNHITHVHYIGINGLISLFLNIENVVLTAWGDDIKTNSHNFFKKFFIKYLLKKSKIITTDSNEMKILIGKIDFSSMNKTKIINFGIDTKFFSKKKYSFYVEEKFKLKNYRNHLKIISLRNHEKVYDIKTLILSIKKLVDKKEKVICLIFGIGSETNMLKTLVRNLNLDKNVFMMGRYNQHELPYIFSIVDCYVSTSLSDAGISASTAEAMSCEICPVSSNNSENSLWIHHKKNGFLFENKNIEQLSYILSNLKNYNLAQLGKLSRKKIIESNDYFNEMKKVEDIYSKLIVV